MKRQSNLTKGLAGLLVGAGALFGGAKDADGGIITIDVDTPSGINSPRSYSEHREGATAGFNQGTDVRYAFTSTKPIIDNFSSDGVNSYAWNVVEQGSNSPFITYLVGRNLLETVQGEVYWKNPISFTDGFIPQATIQNANTGEIIKSDWKAEEKLALLFDNSASYIITMIPEPTTLVDLATAALATAGLGVPLRRRTN
jgi:hypothetical protein